MKTCWKNYIGEYIMSFFCFFAIIFIFYLTSVAPAISRMSNEEKLRITTTILENCTSDGTSVIFFEKETDANTFSEKVKKMKIPSVKSQKIRSRDDSFELVIFLGQ